MRKGKTTIAAVVSEAEREQIRGLARLIDMSVSALLARWLVSILRNNPKTSTRSVRRHKRELFVTLPAEWVSRASIVPGDRLTVTATDDGLLIARK
jgi:hypothetical protein